VTLLELIDAYALAERRHYAAQNEPGTSNGPYGPESRETIQAADEAAQLLAELHRRVALAKADHPIILWSHLDDNERSQRRQRALIAQYAANIGIGRPSRTVVNHCRKDLG
jgi:hypothetical protein